MKHSAEQSITQLNDQIEENSIEGPIKDEVDSNISQKQFHLQNQYNMLVNKKVFEKLPRANEILISEPVNYHSARKIFPYDFIKLNIKHTQTEFIEELWKYDGQKHEHIPNYSRRKSSTFDNQTQYQNQNFPNDSDGEFSMKDKNKKNLFTEFRPNSKNLVYIKHPYNYLAFLNPSDKELNPNNYCPDRDNFNIVQVDLKKMITLIENFNQVGNAEQNHSPDQTLLQYDGLAHKLMSNQQKFPRYQHNEKGNCNSIMQRETNQNLLQHKFPYSTHYPQALIGDMNTDIIFDSRFQSGNLSMVSQENENEYNLLLQNDINTKGYNQWFFFRVNRTQLGKQVKFNILNFSKKNSLFNEGMKPVVYSEKLSDQKSIGWFRAGEDIQYVQNEYERAPDQLGNKQRYFFTLSFSYTFLYDQDTVYFAYNYPYTYSQLVRQIQEIQSDPTKQQIVKVKTLGSTLAGNQLFCLTITNYSKNSQVFDQTNNDYGSNNQKGIVLTARVHPGETVSSYMIKGVIDFLSSSCPEAVSLRNQFIFQIVPMLNPDGVIHGNYRTSLSGCDLNRRWQEPNQYFHRQIYLCKNLINEFAAQTKVVMFCDFHGHSIKKNIFFYGCDDQEKPLACREFPFLVSRLSPSFSYRDCNFQIEKEKEGTARIALWNRLKIPNIFTIESSFCGPTNENKHFSINDLEKVGHRFCQGLLIYFEEEDETQVREGGEYKKQQSFDFDFKARQEGPYIEESYNNRSQETPKIKKNDNSSQKRKKFKINDSQQILIIDEENQKTNNDINKNLPIKQSEQQLYTDRQPIKKSQNLSQIFLDELLVKGYCSLIDFKMKSLKQLEQDYLMNQLKEQKNGHKGKIIDRGSDSSPSDDNFDEQKFNLLVPQKFSIPKNKKVNSTENKNAFDFLTKNIRQAAAINTQLVQRIPHIPGAIINPPPQQERMLLKIKENKQHTKKDLKQEKTQLQTSEQIGQSDEENLGEGLKEDDHQKLKIKDLKIGSEQEFNINKLQQQNFQLKIEDYINFIQITQQKQDDEKKHRLSATPKKNKVKLNQIAKVEESNTNKEKNQKNSSPQPNLSNIQYQNDTNNQILQTKSREILQNQEMYGKSERIGVNIRTNRHFRNKTPIKSNISLIQQIDGLNDSQIEAIKENHGDIKGNLGFQDDWRKQSFLPKIEQEIHKKKLTIWNMNGITVGNQQDEQQLQNRQYSNISSNHITGRTHQATIQRQLETQKDASIILNIMQNDFFTHLEEDPSLKQKIIKEIQRKGSIDQNQEFDDCNSANKNNNMCQMKVPLSTKNRAKFSKNEHSENSMNQNIQQNIVFMTQNPSYQNNEGRKGRNIKKNGHILDLKSIKRGFREELNQSSISDITLDDQVTRCIEKHNSQEINLQKHVEANNDNNLVQVIDLSPLGQGRKVLPSIQAPDSHDQSFGRGFRPQNKEKFMSFNQVLRFQTEEDQKQVIVKNASKIIENQIDSIETQRKLNTSRKDVLTNSHIQNSSKPSLKFSQERAQAQETANQLTTLETQNMFGDSRIANFNIDVLTIKNEDIPGWKLQNQQFMQLAAGLNGWREKN